MENEDIQPQQEPEPEPIATVEKPRPHPATWTQGAIIILLLMWISVAIPIIAGMVRSVPIRWEYTMFIERDNEATEKMNKAGKQGWEIVSVRRVQSRESDYIWLNEILVKRPSAR